ncbi:MAG TPA: hypothetical protein VNJ46_03875 [Gaiellaceae bacterium]|nr:hypothetical protein [Gaiellaceae bacterium]
MRTGTLLRSRLLAAAGGGALFALSNLLLIGIDYDDFAETMPGARFTAHTVLFWSATTCLLFGLVALYATQAGRAGRLGLAGFVLAFVGTAFALATTWSETFALAVLAEEAPALVDDPPGRVAAGLFIAFPVFVAGWTLFAAASLRARVLPRRPALGLLAGALTLLPAFAVPGVGALFGAAVAWLAWAGYRADRA